MGAQRPAIYRARLESFNWRGAPVLAWEAGAEVLHTRGDLVEYVDSTLRRADFSTRARRQVHIPIVWRHWQAHGARRSSFTIEDEAGLARRRLVFAAGGIVNRILP